MPSGSPKRDRKKASSRGGHKGGSSGRRKKRASRPSSPSFTELSGDEDSVVVYSMPKARRATSVLSDAEYTRVLLTVDDALDTNVSRTAPSPPPCAVIDAGVVASAAGDEIHLWSIPSLLKLSPACVETLRPIADDEPDGELFAGQSLFGRRAGRSTTVTLHNSRIHRLHPSSAPIVAMDASVDGTRLAVGDSTGRVFLYSNQGATWQMAEVLRHPRDSSPVSSRGARRTSSGSRAVDASSNAHSSRACCVSLSPDGTRLLTGSKDALRLWSIEDEAGRCSLSGEENGSGSPNDVVFCATWCDDNETLAFSRVHTDAGGSRASTVDTLVVTTVSDLTENIARRDGKSSSLPTDATSHVAGVGRRLLRGHQDAVLCCAFVPGIWNRPEEGGVLLMSGSKDGSVRLWDTNSQACLAVLEGHTDAVTQCRCATEDGTVLTASEDGTVRLWDFDTCLCFTHLDIGSGDPVRFASFLDSVGTAVLTVSGDSNFPQVRTIRTTRVDRPQRLCATPAHDSAVRCIAISPDGLRVATGSQTGGVRIWELPIGSGVRPTSVEGVESSCRCVAELHSPEAAATASTTTHLHWSLDGETIVAANFSGEGDRDPTIRFYSNESDGWQLFHQEHATGRAGASVDPTDLDISSDGSLLSYCGMESDKDYVYILGLDKMRADSRSRGRDTRHQLDTIGPCKASWFATVQSASFSPPAAHSKQHGFLCFFGGLWSVDSGNLLAKVADREGPMHKLNRCCWSNDGLLVAYVLIAPAGSSFLLRLWTVPQDELSASKPPSIAPRDITGDLADDTHSSNFTGQAVVGLAFSPDSNALFCGCTSWDKHGRLQVYKTSTEGRADWVCVGDVNMGGLDGRPWFAPLDCHWWTQVFVPLPQSSASFAIGTVAGQVQVFDFSDDSDGLHHPEDVFSQLVRGVNGEASLSMLEQKLSDRPEMVLCHNTYRSGRTLLHSAVEEANVALTSMLLRVYPGASLAAGISDSGASVLLIAAQSHDADVAELVVNDIISSVRAIDVSDLTMRRSLQHLKADDAIALLDSHPLLFAKLITSLQSVPAPLFVVRGAAPEVALGVPKSLPTDLVAASDQLALPRFWTKYAAELNQEEGSMGIERAIGGEAVVLPMRQPWKLLDPSAGIPLLMACELASEDGGVSAGGLSQFFGVGSFPELLVRQQWEANSSAYAETAYRHGKLLVCFIISSLLMVDSIVSNEVGETLVSHSRSDWEHPGASVGTYLTRSDNSSAAELDGASEISSESLPIGSVVVWFALQPYLLSLWAMDMASVVGRASRGRGDKLLFLSLILLAANGVFDAFLVVSIAYPTGLVIWWDFAVKALTSLLLVLRSLLFLRGSDVMAVVRATGEAILIAVAPAAAVLGALVLGFALTFHTLFSNLDPVHSSFLGSLTATVLALGDTNSLSSQPFSSSPFALVAVPLLYAFIGISVAMVLTIFGIVVRICSDGIPGAAAANLAQERAEIIAYELWDDDTDGQLLALARTLQMPYDLVFDTTVLLLWKLTDLLPWVKILTGNLSPHSPRSRPRHSNSKHATERHRSLQTRGRLSWVHALLTDGSNSAGAGVVEPGSVNGFGSHSPNVRSLTQRLDDEMQQRVALNERLEQMSAQMETLIELVGQSEHSRRRSASADRQSPSPASRAHQSFTPAGAATRRSDGQSHRGRDRRSSSRGRMSKGSTGNSSLMLQRALGEDSPPRYSDEDQQDEQHSDQDSEDENRSVWNMKHRRRRAQ